MFTGFIIGERKLFVKKIFSRIRVFDHLGILSQLPIRMD